MKKVKEILKYYELAFNNYANFKGKANRPEYWYFVLANTVIGMFLSILCPALSMIYSLVLFIPGLSIAFRRLHDIGKSGWWLLINLIPIIGWVWFIVLLATKTKK